MKEYQYSPITVPYKPRSKVKECKGDSPECLKKFVHKTSTVCAKCRHYEKKSN